MNLQKIRIVTSYSPSVLSIPISVIIIVSLLFIPVTASAYEILLGTGEVGSFSHFSGRMLCRTINKKIVNVSCTVKAADDEIDTLTNLHAGSLDLAIINSNILDAAVTKTSRFQFLDINYANLTTLIPLYDRPVAFFVQSNAKISSLSDLKGKRINAGAPGSRERRTMELILKAKGWTVDDFKRFEELPTSQGQAAMAFCQGTVQAMISIGVHPSQETQRLIENCKGVVLDIDDNAIDTLVATSAPYWKAEIQVASDAIPARTFGTRAVLVASSVIDKETGFAITQAIYTNRARLQRSHPALSLFPIEESRKGIKGLQLHQGAEQFFSGQ